MERVLGSTRLSVSSEESVSIETQEKDIHAVAAYRDAEVIHVAVDDGVSGGLSPFEREGLGPWLSGPQLDLWDTLAVGKLDRLTRSLLDFALLLRWAEDNGKNIVSRAENIDLSTPAGKLMAQIIILFAEFERARMAERVLGSKDYRRNQGAWGSGAAPFGYSTEQRGSLKFLVKDHRAQDWQNGRRLLLEGSSAAGVAQYLRDVAGGYWSTTEVMRMYRREVYRGYVTRQKVSGKDAAGKRTFKREYETVTDDLGMPVEHGAPMVTGDEWRELQSVLDTLTVLQSPWETDQLSGCVMCAGCGEVLSHHARTSGDRWRHRNSCSKGAPVTYDAEKVRAGFERDFLGVHGGREMTRTVQTGEDVSGALRDLQERYDQVERSIEDGDMPPKSGAKILRNLEQRMVATRAKGGTTEVLGTGVLLRDAWDSYTPAERNEFLRAHKVAVLVSKDRREVLTRVEHGNLPTLEALYRQAQSTAA